MSLKDNFDDDYVARLLAEDARKTSAKYASHGLSAYVPHHRAADLPKPNTRFLSHIVREADAHNAALKKREERAAQRQLLTMHESDERPRKRRRADETDDAKRNRMFQNIVGAAQSDQRRQDRKSTSGRPSDSCENDDARRPSRRRRPHEHRSTKRRDREDRTRSSVSGSDHAGHDESRRGKRSSSNRAGKNDDRISDTYNSAEQIKHTIHCSAKPDVVEHQRSYELEAAVCVRGRGANAHRSGIDDRFAESYDPSQDVSLDQDDQDNHEDAEDWDLALEAMRDRAKWKRNQASRMREAGFDQEEITKWEKGSLDGEGRERDRKNVRWSRKGEPREWDAGKIEQST